MGSVRRFEELIAWQKARLWAHDIYKATRQPPFSKDFGLTNQIQRASVSTMSNIAEGFERGKRGEFHQYVSIKGSCAEVRSQLYIALDIGYLRQAQFNELMAKGEELSRILGGLRSSLQRQRDAEKD